MNVKISLLMARPRPWPLAGARSRCGPKYHILRHMAHIGGRWPGWDYLTFDPRRGTASSSPRSHAGSWSWDVAPPASSPPPEIVNNPRCPRPRRASSGCRSRLRPANGRGGAQLRSFDLEKTSTRLPAN